MKKEQHTSRGIVLDEITAIRVISCTCGWSYASPRLSDKSLRAEHNYHVNHKEPTP
jgi:hypothetical protein